MRVAGIPENAAKQELSDFMLHMLGEKLELDVDMGFELERVHRISPMRDNSNMFDLIFLLENIKMFICGQ